jgi:hypothetical protein
MYPLYITPIYNPNFTKYVPGNNQKFFNLQFGHNMCLVVISLDEFMFLYVPTLVILYSLDLLCNINIARYLRNGLGLCKYEWYIICKERASRPNLPFLLLKTEKKWDTCILYGTIHKEITFIWLINAHTET